MLSEETANVDFTANTTVKRASLYALLIQP
uniref:Uncharacterized protein n=1 Tax=Rhizophora mucronata TaxID=61149 RepID=A0A2P2R3I8_RHIMU